MVGLGADRMLGFQPFARRVNAGFFQPVSVGASVRVVGQLGASTGPGRALSTTDGGSISVLPEHGDDLGVVGSGFVEIVGTKIGEGALRAVSVLPLPGEFDVELWEEFVKLWHAPQFWAYYGSFVAEGGAL